jgi:transposase-like protein
VSAATPAPALENAPVPAAPAPPCADPAPFPGQPPTLPPSPLLGPLRPSEPLDTSARPPETKWRWRSRPGPRPKIDQETLATVVTRWRQGASVADLAAELGVGRSTLYARLARAGGHSVSRRAGQPRPATLAAAAQARALVEAGHLHREVAAILGCTRARVGQLLAMGKRIPEILPARAETPDDLLAARETRGSA